ncbi:trigger factor [Thermocrinis jamiesonii]|uniref:trigger factor n=1 Tax=Thermocrinis jamiesonii TaxID=1302351 RepID=UPI000498438D|nr:trigger factor [Thermocrinis jamiesonii]
MKVSLEEREGLFKSLKVEVEGQIVKESLEEVYNQLIQNVELEGFRRGKAPLWLIKARYRDYIREEVGKKVADATLQKAIEESNLKPVADIYLEEVELDEKENKLAYRVVFEVPPSFELKLEEIENLQVEVPKIEFKEEMVQEEINRLRDQHALWEPVEREIKEGDMVVIQYNVQDLESGETSEGETTVIVGQKFLREEIERELLNKKEGDEITIDSVDLFDAEGKVVGKAKVKIQIKAVKEKVLPEANDDFAKELGFGETWKEAEEKIRDLIKSRLEDYKERVREGAVVKKLLELHEFEVPQTLLRRELGFLVDARLKELASLGIDTKYLDVQGIAKELLPQAVANIKLSYILDKYAQVKNLEVSPEELESEYAKLASLRGVEVDKVKAEIQSSGLEGAIVKDILRTKALKDIINKVVFVEVETKEEKENENT